VSETVRDAERPVLHDSLTPPRWFGRALPIAATIQAVHDTYWQRHELIESAMLHDPEPRPRASRHAAEAPDPPGAPDAPTSDAS
jgi:hypothetical protein